MVSNGGHFFEHIELSAAETSNRQLTYQIALFHRTRRLSSKLTAFRRFLNQTTTLTAINSCMHGTIIAYACRRCRLANFQCRQRKALGCHGLNDNIRPKVT
jgi:hypothetical protein